MRDLGYTKLVSKYSALGGTSLPLFAKKASQRGRRSSLRRIICIAIAVFALLNLIMWWMLSAHEADETNNRLRSMLATPGAPVMTDSEALTAMYPPSAERVPQRRSNTPPCARSHTLLLVADRDEASRNGTGAWASFLRRGTLCSQANGSFSVEWLDEVPLISPLNDAGRGMELSTLTWFGGKVRDLVGGVASSTCGEASRGV